MRADRLIAALMLLQVRGRITAGELADELEISERTARRDLESLAMSGVPIYSRHGRGGGWFLVGGATTDLTGLSADEATALFLSAGPSLDSTPELQSAIRKLTSALPESFREQAEAAAAAIKIDPAGWGQVGPVAPPHLDVLTDAVVTGRRVDLDYEGRDSARRVRTVDPLGLVTKRNVWYLIGTTDAGRRTYRLSRVKGVTVHDETFDRPVGFDLDAAWAEIVTHIETQRGEIEVRVAVELHVLTPIRWQFAGRCDVGEETADGRFEVTLRESSARAIAGLLAGHGAGVRLIEAPPEVVAELTRISRELAAAYLGGAADTE